jgi:Na+-transporting methylmalonyl-CoA/oxaloacetate decarboxylase beta subunit
LTMHATIFVCLNFCWLGLKKIFSEIIVIKCTLGVFMYNLPLQKLNNVF